METKLPKIPFKAGDDFLLTMTVTNTVSTEAVAAATAVSEAQAIYDAALEADPQVSEDIEDALEVLDAAKADYDEAITVDITDWEITSSLKWITKKIADLVVTKTEPLVGKFIVECPHEDTQLWKPRVHDGDVQFIIDGKKSSSQTFQVDVKRDITMEDL